MSAVGGFRRVISAGLIMFYIETQWITLLTFLHLNASTSSQARVFMHTLLTHTCLPSSTAPGYRTHTHIHTYRHDLDGDQGYD